MDKVLKSRLSLNRLLLENPYAHVEYLEPEFEHQQLTKSLNERIHESRKILQDPYAYLDDSGGYSVSVGEIGVRVDTKLAVCCESDAVNGKIKEGARSRRRSSKEIETLAKNLQTRLWRERGKLWDGVPPADPIELLDPEIALRLVGYDYSVEDGLGTHIVRGGHIEVAGLIDRANKRVHISRQFPMNVRTFTAAHELGHAVLHTGFGGLHRDRPLDGASISRDASEWEADKFATFFLLPEKLIKARFASLFGTDFFELNDDTSFALSGSSVAEVRAKCPTRRDLARLLASAERFNGRHFNSLAVQFHVSVESMAIRLEELALLA